MEIQTVIETLQKVPPAYLNEVNDFMEFIIEKKAAKDDQSEATSDWKVPEWKAGALKGTFTMADDFDETPEDFKDSGQ